MKQQHYVNRQNCYNMLQYNESRKIHRDMWRHTVAEGGSPAGRAVLEVFRLRRELMLHARGRCEHAARVRRQQARIWRLQNTYVHKLVIVKPSDSDKYMTERILASLQFYIVICATQNVWSAFCLVYLLHVFENRTAV